MSSTRAHHHHNWAKTFWCTPERYYQPSNLEEIRDIVKDAHAKKKTIVLVGAGHSPGALTMTNDWIVNLDKFNRLVKVGDQQTQDSTSSNPRYYTDVTVEAGCRVFELHKLLEPLGLAVQNLGSISEQSVGGIFSTGTHGSSAYHGYFSQQIVELQLMLASGEVVTCSSKENPDLFRAALLSLGKLGVIVYVTLRTVPAFLLHTREEVYEFDHFVNEVWPSFWTSSEFVRAWWFPYSDRFVVWRADKTTRPQVRHSRFLMSNRLFRFTYELSLWFATKFAPALTKKIERTFFKYQFGLTPTSQRKTGPTENVVGSVEGLNMDCLFSQFANEWSLPLSTGQNALKELKTKVLEAAESGAYYIHAPFEVRISNIGSPNLDFSDSEGINGSLPGNTLLPYLDWSPRKGVKRTREVLPARQVTNDHLSLFFNATIFRPFGYDTRVQKWFEDLESVCSAQGGKPHWAKNFIGPVTRSEASVKKFSDGEMRGLATVADEWYGDGLDKFKAEQLKVDPTGVFYGNKLWAEVNGFARD